VLIVTLCCGFPLLQAHSTAPWPPTIGTHQCGISALPQFPTWHAVRRHWSKSAALSWRT